MGWRWWWWRFRKRTLRRPCQTLLLRHLTARSDQRLLSNKLAPAPEIWHRHLASCWRHLRQLSVKNPAGPASPRSTAQNPPPHILVLHQFAGPLTASMSKERKKEEKKNADCLKPVASLLTFFTLSSRRFFVFHHCFSHCNCFQHLFKTSRSQDGKLLLIHSECGGKIKKEKVLEAVKPECKRMRGGE